MTTQIMLDASTANENSAVHPHNGGTGSFVTQGTFNTCTLTLQMSADGEVTWITVGADTTMTAAGVANFDLAPCILRVNNSSVGGSTSVSAFLLFGGQD